MKIVTDVAADLQKEEIQSLGIDVAPLYIQFPEGEVKASDISADDFYNRLEALGSKIPTTAMPSPEEFTELYKNISGESNEVLSINISEGLSGTIQSARLASESKDYNVTVVDSQTLSGGQRFQVLAAAFASKAGWTKEKILERLDLIRKKTEVIYTLDTLKYLQAGGRIGRVQSLMASVLDIKPIITVDKIDGKYSTVGKARSIKKALSFISTHVESIYDQETPVWISVLHGQYAEQAEKLAEILQERMNVAKLEILRISPVLGVHTGPGIVGLSIVPMELMEGFA
ncbi:MAG: DegV family protein [Anaerolineaceae bacterium]|nr:DegV family protein [Anaerolineaceae bacterium]